MNPRELEQVLTKTLEDYRLSGNEKKALKDIFSDFASDPETLNFIRNRAFDLVREQIRHSSRHHQESLEWLEKIVKTIDGVKNPVEENHEYRASAHFSPGNSCESQIIRLCRQAGTAIDICVFTISADHISRALLDAHQRKVKLRIITDDDKSHDMGSDIDLFVEKGIPVKMDNSPSHMHHKFAIFDQVTMINGSFNWTRSASMNNNEDIIVNSIPELIRAYSQRFEQLWKSCVPA